MSMHSLPHCFNAGAMPPVLHVAFPALHRTRDRTRIAPDECGGTGMMTRKIQVHQVDAFTRERFTGNPAGVVLNADGLTESQMLAIARELNNADTAFILSPENGDHTVRAR